MSMTKKLLSMAALAGLLVGCSRSAPPPAKPAAAAPAPLDARGDARAQMDLAQQLMTVTRQLPGRDEAEDLQLVQRSLADISSLLHTLAGKEPSGDLRQQLKIIENSRTKLAGMSPDSAVEPTIDSALRSANQAITMIVRDKFASQADINQLVERLTAKTRDLDSVRGPMHRLVVSQTIDLTAQTLQRMTAVQAERVGA